MKLYRIALVALVALAWLAGATLAHAALPPGVSGSWYNPEQPGHGITLEVLDETRTIGGWYVYDRAGNPINLYLEGEIDGNSIRSKAYIARGMRFGNFNPADLLVGHWGTVTLEFSSCNAVTLRWNADGPAGIGYGSGAMPMSRLTRIAGLGCVFVRDASPTLLPTGTYTGTWERRGPNHGTPPYRLHAAVDSSGRLWAAPEWSPGPSYVSAVPPPPVFFGAPPRRVDGRVVSQVEVRHGVTLRDDSWRQQPGISLPLSFSVFFSGAASASASISEQPSLVERFEISHEASPDSLRQGNFDPATLSGRTFRFQAYEQFFGPRTVELNILDGSRFCIAQSCDFAGRIGAVDPELAMFDVEILNTRRPDLPAFVGKAWVSGTPRRLVIAAHDGTAAFSVVAIED